MKYGKTFTEALREISKLQEDGHTDVASAVRQCKTAIEDASEMLSKLQGMNPEGDLPSWWMNKIAIAANSMNKLRDYLLVPSTNEAKEIPPIDKDNKPGVKIAKIRAMKDKGGTDTKIGPAGKIALAKEKDQDGLEAQIIDLKGKLALVNQQLENEKNKVVKPQPNPDTGEVPLRTGIAAALLDKTAKKKVKDVLNRVKQKKEIKVGGKTKVDIDPDMDIGQFSGGNKTPTSNLG